MVRYPLKKNVLSCYLIVVAIVLLFSLIGIACTAENVHYVDSAGDNFLFRGGSLIDDNGNFIYEDLHDSIISAGNESGVRVPESFYLIDVNLLNQVYNEDMDSVLAEFEFFHANPDLGRLIYWDTKGSDLSPDASPVNSNEPFRLFLANNLADWFNDPLVVRVDTLHELLTGSGSKLGISGPIVIYVHCMAGCDRTGEMIGAYQLRYMNKTWQDVNSISSEFCGDTPISCNNHEAMKWYCLWLNKKYGFPEDCEKSYQCDG